MGIKDMWQNFKKESAYNRAAIEEANRREKAAYYRAKASEAEKFGVLKAKAEREHRLKTFKSKLNQPKTGFGGLGFGFDTDSMSSGLNAWAGGGGASRSSSPRTRTKTTYKHFKKNGRWVHQKVKSKTRTTPRSTGASSPFGIDMVFDMGF